MASRLDRLAAALGLGPAAPVLEGMRALYRDLDREIARGADGRKLPCRRGCSSCCHEAVFLAAPEFLVVVAELNAWSPDRRGRLVGEMREIAARFEDELELLETIPPGPERDEVARRVRFRCPLLTDEEECGIYAARELNARTFGQSWDGRRNEAYGCALTHEALPVLPVGGPTLFDAREARRRLAASMPKTEFVHVFPWWFDRYADHLS